MPLLVSIFIKLQYQLSRVPIKVNECQRLLKSILKSMYNIVHIYAQYNDGS